MPVPLVNACRSLASIPVCRLSVKGFIKGMQDIIMVMFMWIWVYSAGMKLSELGSALE